MPACSAVELCLYGHTHADLYHFDEETRLHHRSLEAVLQCAPGSNAFGVIEVGEGGCELRGEGLLCSQLFPRGAPDESSCPPPLPDEDD